MEEEGYIGIGWPEIQEYMEYEGFELNSTAMDEPGEYLVNREWVKAVLNGSVARIGD